MKSKIIKAIGAGSLVVGMLALSGCFESTYPAYGYGPGYYAEPAPVIVGDYDEHHVWHDRDWWVSNRRDWVSNHHTEWLSHDNGHAREVHASVDRDHNREVH